MAKVKLIGNVSIGFMKPFEYNGSENGQAVKKKGMEIKGYVDRFVSGQKKGELFKFVDFDPQDAALMEKYLTAGRRVQIEAVPQLETKPVKHTETFSLAELKAVVAEMEAKGESEKTLDFDVEVQSVFFKITDFDFCDSQKVDNAPAKAAENAPARRWGSQASNAPARSNAPLGAPAKPATVVDPVPALVGAAGEPTGPAGEDDDCPF